MRMRAIFPAVLVGVALLVASCSSASSSSSPSSSVPTTTTPSTGPTGVDWMPGYISPGTPAKYNKVGVIKVGPRNAKNVLVVEPGLASGSAYLGYIKDSSIKHHLQAIPNSSVHFAAQWGMNVAVQDLHNVVDAAKKLKGKVVLSGHSLGGSVTTAYATWDFAGHAGADDLAGCTSTGEAT